jgi:hypothetical protein
MCRPEGNMVEGYIFYEALGFYTKYMQNFGASKGAFGMPMKRKG